MNHLPEFSTWFQALWAHEPFPWQRMLAERLVEGVWPGVLDLPTAAGKTACIDIAVYALAAQADRPVAERTAPRRIWLVVDRRIVVDEAFERARTIAARLEEATDGPLREIAERLRGVGGTGRPLAVARLRGGVLRDDGWARLPSQPAVITSTVDQLGSRLLFRGYGHSPRTAAIFAGLAAHDSLILLDEAHLSVPFLETLRAVERYRGPEWAEAPLRTPFGFTVLSATPPASTAPEGHFPGRERDTALDHPVLRRRMAASKPARLVQTKGIRPGKADPLVQQACTLAGELVDGGARRVGVVVNRVATAEAIARSLQDAAADRMDMVLLTGRLRPFDRDRLVGRWVPHLRAAAPVPPARPVVVVATQCIEVGADLSFDALVTEAASLDALRQRFGRLNRLGEAEAAPAAILIRPEDAKKGARDPIYGDAMAATWALLNDLAGPDGRDGPESGVVDLGIQALDDLIKAIDDLAPYLAPVSGAPALLPAHLDLLCQTAPAPAVTPDVALYLHGTDRGHPEVRVAWRADLDPTRPNSWPEIAALSPPNSQETLSVSFPRFRQWLGSRGEMEDTPDVEGVPAPEQGEPPRSGARPVLLWRGRERSRVAFRASEIRPDDTVIVPLAYGLEGLAQSMGNTMDGDVWERTHAGSGRPPGVRIHREVWRPWLDVPPVARLIEVAEDPAPDSGALQEAIEAVLEYVPEDDEAPLPPPEWLHKLLATTRRGRVERHPTGGLVLLALGSSGRGEEEQDLFADDDDLLSATGQQVPLDVHSALVERAVSRLARRCLPEELVEPLRMAALWHDVGKADERFQLWLREGDELEALTGPPLAKSRGVPLSPGQREWLREASRLPQGFRHEMLSMQLAERHGPHPGGTGTAALVLHEVASHHGHGRPFSPICLDPDPPGVRLNHAGIEMDIGAAERRSWPAPHHALGSGTADRFWRLNRRCGWWGLAYLEAILRLGDWYGSRHTLEDAPDTPARSTDPPPTEGPRPSREDPPRVLTGIDGANPLGFLSALGTLVVLHHMGCGDTRLAWRRQGLTWRPELHGLPASVTDHLPEVLAEGLRGAVIPPEAAARREEAEARMGAKAKVVKKKQDEVKKRGLRGGQRREAWEAEVAPLEAELEALRRQWLEALRAAVPRPELALGKHIDPTAAEFRGHVDALLTGARWDNRESLDLLGAFASDGCLHENDRKRKDGIVAATPFCFVTGSGHQYFLDSVLQLLGRVDAERIRSMLDEPWVYADEGLSLRWDPIEARRYALMDRDPTASDNKARTEWMANILAYRSLILFPSAPTKYGLATTGWSRQEEDEVFTWPLWSHPCGPDAVRSLLGLQELHSLNPDHLTLHARDVVAAYRAKRIKVGSGANFKVNFSAARQV